MFDSDVTESKLYFLIPDRCNLNLNEVVAFKIKIEDYGVEWIIIGIVICTKKSYPKRK